MEVNGEFQQCIDMGICPVCKRRLIHMEGCLECPACGWSLCKEA